MKRGWQLTFSFYKLVQNARLSCSSAADHQKLEKKIWEKTENEQG